MKRNPRKVKWTKAYRALQGKDLRGDAVFNFERRRNRPLKYNRTLVRSTLTAIVKLDSIRTRRSNRFYENRTKNSLNTKHLSEKQMLKQHLDLIRSPHSNMKKKNIREEVRKVKVTSSSVRKEE